MAGVVHTGLTPAGTPLHSPSEAALVVAGEMTLVVAGEIALVVGERNAYR